MLQYLVGATISLDVLNLNWYLSYLPRCLKYHKSQILYYEFILTILHCEVISILI